MNTNYDFASAPGGKGLLKAVPPPLTAKDILKL